MFRRVKRLAVVLAMVVAIGCYFQFVYDPAPVAHPDQAEINDIAPAKIDVLSNDTDWRNDTIKVVAVGQPQHGKAVIGSKGADVVYTPAAGFGGEDQFTYMIADKAGHQASGDATVKVNFTAPQFHKRNTAASLQEMLSEPATSMYGSTINVYVYRDTSGAVREITIAGHADSITCSITSGAFASALIESGMATGDFSLAGAGRLTVPVLSDEDRDLLMSDPDVRRYDNLRHDLDTVRTFSRSGLFTDAQIRQTYGWSVDEGQAQLKTLEASENVRRYLRSASAAESAEAFLDQARDLRETSGMLRLHDLKFDVIEAVQNRLQNAAKSQQSAVLTFADLGSGEDAVVYTPMLKLGSGEPVVLKTPVGNFSPDGFRAAAKEHRSAMEKALEGSAQRRYEHATRILDQERETKKQCDSATREERSRSVETEQCNQNECSQDLRSRLPSLVAADHQLTLGEYCDTNNPENLITFAQWQKDAGDILDRMKSLRAEQDSLRVDALTHAALVDSMLRDWALPMPDAQAAFDHWRTVGRNDAWKALTAVIAEQGIARSVISGESVVFDISLDGDTLVIRPMLAIDLARSRVVVDRDLGALAIVDPWELRTITDVSAKPLAMGDPAKAVLDDPDGFKAALLSDPSAVMEKLLDDIFQRLPANETEQAKLRKAAELQQVHLLEQALRKPIREESDRTPNSRDEKFNSLDTVAAAARAVRDLKGFRPEFVAETIHANARAFIAFLNGSAQDAWRYAQSVVDNQGGNSTGSSALGKLSHDLQAAGFKTQTLNLDALQRLEFVVYGSSFEDIIAGALDGLGPADRETVKSFFKPGVAPVLDMPDLDDLPPSDILNQVTWSVESARAALSQRQAIDAALDAYSLNGEVTIAAVRKSLDTVPPAASAFNYFTWSQLVTEVRDMEFASHGEVLNPIDAARLAQTLTKVRNDLDLKLTNVKPRILALRYGRDQEAIAARLLFDSGAYLQALDRLTIRSTPLSLFAPNLKWEVLAPDLKAIPDNVRMVAEGQSVLVEATVGGERLKVLQLDGLDAKSIEALTKATAEPVLPWNEGDPLWEQILLAVVPVIPDAQHLADAFEEDGLRLATLKAMVYACALPGGDILQPDGRCARASGSNELHDRVRAGAVSFALPSVDTFDETARKRFTSQGAWLLQIVN